MAAADRARARGRVKKAIAGYRKALESDPSDPAVNVKLAPLLARVGDRDGSARCFRTAANKHLEAGFTDRAAAVNLAATGVFPLDPGFRMELARLNVMRGRKQDALATLIEGARAIRKARRPDAAAALLKRAVAVEPWHLEASLLLVPLLWKSGGVDAARQLLGGLESRNRGGALRRVRWVAFRMSPSPASFWRFLRTSAGARAAPAAAPAERPAPRQASSARTRR